LEIVIKSAVGGLESLFDKRDHPYPLLKYRRGKKTTPYPSLNTGGERRPPLTPP